MFPRYLGSPLALAGRAASNAPFCSLQFVKSLVEEERSDLTILLLSNN